MVNKRITINLKYKGELKKLSLKLDDIILLKIPGFTNVDKETRFEVRKSIDKTFKELNVNNKVIILDSDFDIEIFKKENK